jgi:uncharacterized membrane protein HdeD (DUF308 family)
VATASPATAFQSSAYLDDLTEALRAGRRRLTIAGIVAMVLGAVAIVVPAVASVAIAIFLGWILVIASIYEAIDAFAARHTGRIAIRLLFTALTLAAGLYLLLAPLSGVFTLTVMLVIWFVATGAARIVVGIAERPLPGWWLTVTAGVVKLGLGILIAERLPSSADWALGLIVGIDLFFSGALLLSLARQLSVAR